MFAVFVGGAADVCRWAVLQAVRKRGLWEKRAGARAPAVSLPGVRLSLHRHAAAGQAARDEGVGGAAVWHGRHELQRHRPLAGRQRRGGAEMDTGGGVGFAGAGGRGRRGHGGGGRDVACPEKKSAKLWIWRAYDVDQRRTVAWVLGGRDDATCRRLLDRVGLRGKTFITEDWEGYHRLIPQDQLFTGKDLTFPIEQDNSNVRHYLARFRRRTKVVSKCRTMVDLSLRLLHHLQDPANYAAYATKFATIFG